LGKTLVIRSKDGKKTRRRKKKGPNSCEDGKWRRGGKGVSERRESMKEKQKNNRMMKEKDIRVTEGWEKQFKGRGLRIEGARTRGSAKEKYTPT